MYWNKIKIVLNIFMKFHWRFIKTPQTYIWSQPNSMCGGHIVPFFFLFFFFLWKAWKVGQHHQVIKQRQSQVWLRNEFHFFDVYRSINYNGWRAKWMNPEGEEKLSLLFIFTFFSIKNSLEFDQKSGMRTKLKNITIIDNNICLRYKMNEIYHSWS